MIYVAHAAQGGLEITHNADAIIYIFINPHGFSVVDSYWQILLINNTVCIANIVI
jgi:hypothetical protein